MFCIDVSCDLVHDDEALSLIIDLLSQDLLFFENSVDPDQLASDKSKV